MKIEDYPTLEEYLAERKALSTKVEEQVKATLLGTAEKIVVEYNGSNDSGSIEFIGLRDHFDKPVADELNDTTRGLIESYCYDQIEQKHDGWESNYGGDGEFTINLITGVVKWRHSTIYMETRDDLYTL